MNQLFSSAPLWREHGLALVRIITGIFMIYHGWEIFDAEKMNGYLEWDMFKNAPYAKFMLYLGKGAELVSGILLLFGLFTRIASVMMILALGYIAFFVGHGKIWYEDQHPFLFVLLGLVFFFCGAGRLRAVKR
jgi:putative oxidoreductase